MKCFITDFNIEGLYRGSTKQLFCCEFASQRFNCQWHLTYLKLLHNIIQQLQKVLYSGRLQTRWGRGQWANIEKNDSSPLLHDCWHLSILQQLLIMSPYKFTSKTHSLSTEDLGKIFIDSLIDSLIHSSFNTAGTFYLKQKHTCKMVKNH